jgi:hypothetical protein
MYKNVKMLKILVVIWAVLQIGEMSNRMQHAKVKNGVTSLKVILLSISCRGDYTFLAQ